MNPAFPGIEEREDIARALGRIFIHHGASVERANEQSGLFLLLAACVQHPPEELKHRDRGDRKVAGREDTVAPVEKLLEAVKALRDAIEDCCEMAEVDVGADKINTSRVFSDLAFSEVDTDCDPDQEYTRNWWHRELLFMLCLPAEQALGFGVGTSKGRPPNLIYDKFLDLILELSERLGLYSGSISQKLVDLTFECQKYLDPHLRATDESQLRKRIESMIARKAKSRRHNTRLRRSTNAPGFEIH